MDQRPTRTIDAVVFDIGNVLIRWDPMNLFRKLFADEAAARAFMAEVDLMALHATFDAGAPFAPGLAALQNRFPHYAHAIAAYGARWDETFGGAIADNVTLLADLRAARVPVYAISNFSREKFDETKPLFPFLGTFDVPILSADFGVNKPDPAIYRALLERVPEPAERMIFIDDMSDNIAAAAALGFQTFHFPQATPAASASLRGHLRAAGLPV